MPSSSIYGNKLLFEKIAGGDEASFEDIFKQYRVSLYNMACKLTRSHLKADEITQEVFVSLWVSRAQLANVEHPEAYLYRILFNKVSNYLRKEANQERIIKDAMQFRPTRSNTTEEQVDVHDSQRIIEQALEQMPRQQKLVYRLSRQQGLSNDEIAHQLNISPHTVKSHLSKALEFIRLYLKGVAVVAALWTGFRDLPPF